MAENPCLLLQNKFYSNTEWRWNNHIQRNYQWFKISNPACLCISISAKIFLWISKVVDVLLSIADGLQPLLEISSFSCRGMIFTQTDTCCGPNWNENYRSSHTSEEWGLCSDSVTTHACYYLNKFSQVTGSALRSHMDVTSSHTYVMLLSLL